MNITNHTYYKHILNFFRLCLIQFVIGIILLNLMNTFLSTDDKANFFIQVCILIFVIIFMQIFFFYFKKKSFNK